MLEIGGFLLALGAVLRLTRLVTDDTIMQPVRQWVHDRMYRAAPTPAARRWNRFWTWVDMGINCPWCVSVWVATAVVGLAAAAGLVPEPTWWIGTATMLTLSWLTAILAGALDRSDEPHTHA